MEKKRNLKLPLFLLSLVTTFILAKEDSLKSISTALNSFSSNLLKHINNNEKNLVFSPLSAHMILSLAAYGASGNTAKQMKDALSLPKDDALGKKEFQYLTKYFNKIENVTLETANSIYLSNTFKVKQEFKNFSKLYFLSEVSELDFSDVQKSISIINNWAGEKTHNKIPSIVSEKNIDEDTKVILLNAIYFKGKWDQPFVDKFTKDLPFHLNEKEKKNVPTMIKESNLVYGDLPKLEAKFIKLPYENKNLKMILIVPDKIDGLDTILQNIVDFTDKNGKVTNVFVRLPKFKIESKIALNEPLQELGMTDMFSKRNANFTGISEEKLNIASVFQKAMIEVNEEGSEATAVTVIVGDRNLGPRPVDFDVNRPFYYRIVDDYYNIILFEGICRDPVY